MACVDLLIYFSNGDQRSFPVHHGGDWRYTTDAPERLIVRPFGREGSRHEIPLRNVLSIMVVKDR